MGKIRISVPLAILEEMNLHSEVDWNEIAVKEIRSTLAKLGKRIV